MIRPYTCSCSARLQRCSTIPSLGWGFRHSGLTMMTWIRTERYHYCTGFLHFKPWFCPERWKSLSVLCYCRFTQPILFICFCCLDFLRECLNSVVQTGLRTCGCPPSDSRSGITGVDHQVWLVCLVLRLLMYESSSVHSLCLSCAA